jgi:hypothetical protein
MLGCQILSVARNRLRPDEFEIYTKTVDDWMQQNLVWSAGGCFEPCEICIVLRAISFL